MRREEGAVSGWRYGTLGIIALFTLILIIRWRALPVFLDIYYHTACMTGFKDACGVVLHDFWEYAPLGRPQLYPPLFSIILLALVKLGLNTLFVIRLVSVAIFPFLLGSIAWVITKLYDDKRAFFTVLAASLPYTFFINAIAAIPSSIVLIILIFLFYAVETKKTICAILLLGMSFYVHGGLPWLIILTLLIYAALRRENFKFILTVILGGIILGIPWIVHMAANRSYFLAVNSHINRYFEANLFLYIAAILGAGFAVKEKGRNLFFLAMLFGMLPMIKDYTFRFLCGEGLLSVIFLAGIGLDRIYSKTAEFLKLRMRPVIYTILVPWFLFYAVTFHSPGGSAFSKFANHNPEQASALESSIYTKKYMEELVAIIKANTAPDDIIYCNYSYAAGIFYAFSGRVTSSGMLSEVRPYHYSDPAVAAKLTIWIKNPESIFDPELKSLISRLGLVKVAETEFAYVYKNPFATAHRILAKPVITAKAAFFILFTWVCAIFACMVIL